ncbi:MAG: FtsX-like permease family protein [Candidatus Lokiarchaeota archaeon]|nr:FtsX-like permease family protein [Candidatus Lokiarchaeota archaeon]
MKNHLFQINLIPRNRIYYAFIGLILASLLFSATTTSFTGVYSYLETYLGESEDILIITQEGSGRTIATGFIDLNIAHSASYINGVLVSSPETLTPSILNDQVYMVRGIDTTKFSMIDEYTILQGRNLSMSDLSGALVGERVAQKSKLEIGSRFIIFSSLRDVTLELTVLGIFKSSKDSLNDEILVPLPVGQWISGHYPSLCTFIRLKFSQDEISKSQLENMIMRKHTLSIYVNDRKSNLPIEDAEVNIYDINEKLVFSGQTDSIGNVNIDLSIGNYTINVSKNGIKKSQSIYLLRDMNRQINISTDRKKHTLSVKIFNHSIPLEDRTVIIWKDSNIILMDQTNGSGILEVSLPEDNYQIATYYWNEYSKSQVEYTQYVFLDTNMTLDFYFKNYSICFYTVDPITKEFINAEVVIKNLNGTIIQSDSTGSDGFICFNNLRPDYYNITITAGDSTYYDLLTLKSDLTRHYSILPFFKLNISVYNTSSHDPMNASIKIVNLENDVFINNNTGLDGNICFDLESRNYNITCDVYGYSDSEIINLNGNLNISFWIPPYLTVFQILNSSFSPMPGLNLSVSNQYSYYQGITNLTGHLKLYLSPSEYNITINLSRGIYSTELEVKEIYQDFEIITPPYNLTVYVYNGSSDEKLPVINKSVNIYNITTSNLIENKTTNSKGVASFLIENNIYNLSLNLESKNFSKIININDNNKDVYFYTPPYNLTVNITSSIDKNPMENVTVQILKLPYNEEIASGNTTSAGIFKTMVEEAGEYNISIIYLDKILNQTIFINADPVIKFDLPPYNITILVKDKNGPLKNANVSVNLGPVNQTNEYGLTWFILNQDLYNLTIQYEEFERILELDLRPLDPDQFIEITLLTRHSLNISVNEAINGVPIENACIKIYYNNTLVESDKTNSFGHIKFQLDENQEFLYNISVQYYNSDQFRLLNLTKDTFMNFSIIKNNMIEISVLNGLNNPLKYAKIILKSTDGMIHQESYTNSRGLNTFYLPSNTYNITVKRNGFSKQTLLDIWSDKKILFYLPPYQLNINVKNSTNYLKGIEVQLAFLNETIIDNNYTNAAGIASFSIYESSYKIIVHNNDNNLTKSVNTIGLNSSIIQLSFIFYEDEKSDYAIADPADYSSSLLEQTFGLTKSTIYILTIIITILVSLSIMNVVSSSINETRRYIGMVKAIGASNLQVYIMIGLRIFIISILAGIIGGLLGIITGSLISLFGFQLYITQIFSNFNSFLEILGISVLINLFITFISSSYTLYKINKLKPAEALREIITSK